MNAVRLFLRNLRQLDSSPAVLRVVKQIEAEQDALAEAWDEGYLRGVLDEPLSTLDPTKNPYREAA